MRVRRSLPRTLAAVSVVALAPTAVRAQSPADSVAVMRALGLALREEARAVLNGFACFDGLHPCPTPRRDSADARLAELAQAAGARLVPEARGAIPPCPWGYGPKPPGAGFLVGIARVSFNLRADTARVLVLKKCDNPPGYLHDVFGQDDEYHLVRGPDGQWQVAGKRMTRITRRNETPGIRGGGAPTSR